ncbi:low molecular weight phosphatase family protein [Rubellicoccus peritrichatus]|uniref:Low molecular weight phosphatase family protein n=1 Tax=Rubellicoccus peritrichatus TaxID=3080537 RepID=A0AAQ3LCC7_9BACT|nr:low molecular weight phosphatase family protein [Puniceicoccus sp. CR14]WOO41275.1 low molecular weight phosphatase family protein [Puniceicoccus sp. CR14]
MGGTKPNTGNQWILFLCTGNYYRSRFAEAIFNHRAEQLGIGWRAFSRGLDLQPHVNFGPISKYTREALAERSIPIELTAKEPAALQRQDLIKAHHIIALKEAEHRPLMHAQFPDSVDSVEYWTVHDLDAATAEEALPMIEKLVAQVLDDVLEKSNQV